MTTTTLIDLGLTWATKTLRDGRVIRSAPATEAFWKLWRASKSSVKGAGYGVSEYPKGSGNWVVTDWNDRRDSAELSANADRIAASRNVTPSAGFSAPSPEGWDYYPYQLAGIEFLVKHATESCLIGDPMGTGKSIICAGVLNVERPSKVLIICPNTVKINWFRELSRWLVVPRRIDLVNGTSQIPGIDRANQLQSIPKNPDIIIIHYDALSKHQDAIHRIRWGCVIMDEGHYLKTPDSARSKVALAIKADRRLILTGTPLPNRPREIQPLAGYLDPENFGDAWGFKYRYCDPQKNRWGTTFDGATNMAELQDRLRSTIMLRRDKAAVLPDLPPKIRQVLVLDPSKYSKVLKAEAQYDSLGEALKDMDSNSAEFEEMSKVRHETGLAKVDDVVEHLLGTDEAVVVFAHHQDVIENITQALIDAGRTAVSVSGPDSIDKRQQAIDAFQNGEVQYFVGSISTTGEGITLTRASHCLFAEIDFVPGRLRQCEDRLCRIGQQSKVLVQHIVVSGSLDGRMIEHLVEKQAVIDAALDAETPQKEPRNVGSLPSVHDAGSDPIRSLEEIAAEMPTTASLANLVTAVTEANVYLQAEGLTIYAASKHSTNPGCLYVKNAKDEYQGKVTPDGEFRASRDAHRSTASKLALVNADTEAYMKANAERIADLSASQRDAKPHSFDDYRGTVTDIDLTNLPNGLYAVPQGDSRLKVRISRGRQGGKWAGTIFVEDAAVYGQRQRYGMQRLEETYQGGIADPLRAILADPFEASKEYGRLTSTCGVCGKALEDEISVANGIGPICAGKFG